MNAVEGRANKAKTGIWGLDNILSGGFSRGHVFLAEGAPGTGKTTVAALIIKYLIENNKIPSLAVDADPNSNLPNSLGVNYVKSIGEVLD
ncbi:MAG: ATPase domain-containing protein, partial [Bradyrhizobium sp.]|nr:ATPase domain-containing protein [Bradyrhizobium sp.]